MADARVEDLSPEWREYWNERAAIRQFDGGYSKRDAEELALEDTNLQIFLTASEI